MVFFLFLLYNTLADKDQNLRIYAQKERKTSDCLLIFYVPLISAGLYSVQRFFFKLQWLSLDYLWDIILLQFFHGTCS